MAAAFAAIAALSPSLSFCGWLFDIQALRGYGFDASPIWPQTALAYALLSMGYVAWILGRTRLAYVLWGVPLAVAMLALVQNVFGLEFGTDNLLFPDALSRYQAPHPGRPGYNPSIILLLLSIAGYAFSAGQTLLQSAKGLMATIAAGLAGATAVLVFVSSPASTHAYFFVPMPALVTAAALGIALAILHAELGWVRLLAERRAELRSLRLLVPAVILFPVVPSVLELTILRAERVSPVLSETVVVLCNIFIVALIVYWAVTRVAVEQSAMVELTQALDQTTVALTDADGVILHWSRGCEALYGWSASEALGQQKYALLRSRCPIVAGSPTAAPSSDSVEMIEFARDFREVRVIETVQRVESPGRAPVHVLSIVDVTQRTAMVEALKQSEERLSLATSAHELGIFEWDVASGRIEWSPGTEQRLGLAPGTIHDFESWRAQVEPEDVQGILDTIARTVQNRTPKFSFRYRFLQQNGAIRAVEGSSRAFYDSDGNLLRTVGVIIDISEREQREGALRRREAQLRSVLETVPDAMVVVNAEGTVLQFSKAAEQLWGYRAADVVGRNFTMLSPAAERAGYRRTLAQFIATGEGVEGQVLRAVAETADGRHLPIETRTGVARFDKDMLLTVFVRDLSDQLATETRLRDLNEEIAHVSRQSAMSELAADLAHELNQPLSATANFLAAARMLLQRGESPERATELLRLGNEQTQRAGEIIRRLRAFMARGEVEMRSESVEKTVRDAVELALVGTGQLRMRVEYDLDPDVPRMFADRIQVQQVLLNLMRNAMEALRSSATNDPYIVISSRKVSDQFLELSVSDNGPGIPPHVLENLFTRFTTTKANGGGMGIGLSISKRIIEAHGGILHAENKAKGGAAFRFTLPAVEQGGD